MAQDGRRGAGDHGASTRLTARHSSAKTSWPAGLRNGAASPNPARPAARRPYDRPRTAPAAPAPAPDQSAAASAAGSSASSGSIAIAPPPALLALPYPPSSSVWTSTVRRL